MTEADDVTLAPEEVSVLQAIYENEGKLTAELVVAEAQRPGSVLASRFTWDDAEAAREFRLAQARQIIRSVKVTVEDRRVRAYVFVKSEKSYAPLHNVMTNRDWRAEMLAEFERDAERFRQKWESHKFVADHYRAWLRSQKGVAA